MPAAFHRFDHVADTQRIRGNGQPQPPFLPQTDST